MSSSSRTFFPDWLRRFFAAAGAALVLALTIFSASPLAHRWLHAVTTPDNSSHCHHHHAGAAHAQAPAPDADLDDHTCAVVLFSSGVDLPVAPFALTPPRLVAAGVSPVTAAELHLLSPRYLRQPERGPPSSGLL